jgi:hypothetical protein
MVGRLVIVVLMAWLARVIVAMAPAAQFQEHEASARGDQEAAHDRVLGALNGGTKLQTDGDDHRPEDDRDQHVGNSGQPG